MSRPPALKVTAQFAGDLPVRIPGGQGLPLVIGGLAAGEAEFNLGPTVIINWDKILRWSADSKMLTYTDNRGGVENLWGQPIDGGAPKQLTTFGDSYIFSFDWARDGNLRDGNLIVSRGVRKSDVVLMTDAGQ